MSKRRHQRTKWRSLYVWHRTLGLTAAIFAIGLSLTGMALNHGHGLSLDRHHISSVWLLDLYNIQPVTAFPSFQTPKGLISQVGERLYLDQVYLLNHQQSLVGALWHQDQFVIALESSIILLNPDGELIEQQDQSSGLPTLLFGIAASSNTVLISSNQGVFESDPAILQWHPAAIQNAAWIDPVAAPPELRQRLAQDQREHIITWERLLFDLHSGRLFGPVGVLLIDLSGLLILFLALSGVFIWSRQRAKHR